jgi:CBS domain-containing protein
MMFKQNTVTAMEGFRLIAQHGVSAMPIVAANGTLSGTLSISDLRGMDASKFKAL